MLYSRKVGIDNSGAEQYTGPQAQNNELSEMQDVHVSQGLQTLD